MIINKYSKLASEGIPVDILPSTAGLTLLRKMIAVMDDVIIGA
jgi:hypothetical protein